MNDWDTLHSPSKRVVAFWSGGGGVSWSPEAFIYKQHRDVYPLLKAKVVGKGKKTMKGKKQAVNRDDCCSAYVFV